MIITFSGVRALGFVTGVLAVAVLVPAQAHAESNGRALADCVALYDPRPYMSEGAYEDTVWSAYWSGYYAPNSAIDMCAARLGWAPIYPGFTEAQKDAALHGIRVGTAA